MSDFLNNSALQPRSRTLEISPARSVVETGYLEEELPVQQYWRILQRRKYVAIIFTVAVVTLATVGSFRMRPKYEAVSRISIRPENFDTLEFKDLGAAPPSDWDYTIELEAQVRILQSDTLALRTIEQLHLDENPLFFSAKPNPSSPPSQALSLKSPPDAKQQAALLSAFRSSLEVSKIPHSPVIEIHFTSRDPRLSAEVVNTLVNSYVEENFQARYNSMQQASQWLSKQLVDLQMQVDAAQERLVKYEKEKGIVGIDDKQNIVTESLDQLNKELTSAQADRIQKEAVDKAERSGDPELAPSVAESSVVQHLKQQEAELSNQYALANTMFGPSYPKVQELKNALDQTHVAIQQEAIKIAQRAHAEYGIALQREQMLHRALDNQKLQANDLNESAIQYETLKHDVESSRLLYEGMLTKLKEAGVFAGLQSSNIRVVDPARPPAGPSSPNIPLNIALALLCGVVGGVTLSLIIDRFDDAVWSPAQAETLTALPGLAVIPMLSTTVGKMEKRSPSPQLTGEPLPSGHFSSLSSYFYPGSEVAEAYRALRTSILLSGFGAPPKTIMITSSLPQEGKTTTSINCAIVLAQRGGRVLLVDADLRRSGLRRALGISTTAGLSTVLAGIDSFEKSVIPSPQLRNLFVLPAGRTPPNPAELLSSNSFKNQLARWRQDFDHIIIDTPPVLSVTDAVALSVEVDSVILVVRAGQTNKTALLRARELLSGVNARTTGVVVNAVDAEISRYYGYGYAGYGEYPQPASAEAPGPQLHAREKNG